MAFRSGVKIFSRLKNNGIPGCTIRSLSERRYLVTPAKNESGPSGISKKENVDSDKSPNWFSLFSRSKSADSRLPVQSKIDVTPELEKDLRFEKTEGPAYLFMKETRHVFSNPDFVQCLPRLDPKPAFSTVEKRLLDLQERQVHPDYGRIEQLKTENIEEQKKFTSDNKIHFSSTKTQKTKKESRSLHVEHATRNEPSSSKIPDCGVSKNTKKGHRSSHRHFSTSTGNLIKSSEKARYSELTNDGSIIETKSSKTTPAELIKKYIGLYPEAQYMRPNVKRALTETEETDYLHNILKFISKKESKMMQQCSKENTDKLINPSKLKNFTPNLLSYYKSKVQTLNKHTSMLRRHSDQVVTKSKVNEANTRTYSTIALKYRKLLISRTLIENNKRARNCPPRKRNDNKTCKDVKDIKDEQIKSLRKQTEGAYDPEKFKSINSACMKPDCKPKRKYSTLATSMQRKPQTNLLITPSVQRGLSRRQTDDTDPTILSERKKTEGGCPIPTKCPKIKLDTCPLANQITNCAKNDKAPPCEKIMAPHPAFSECKEDDIEKLPTECKDCPKAIKKPERYTSPAMFCDQDTSKCRRYSTSATFSFPSTNLIKKKSYKQPFHQKSVVCSLSKYGRCSVSRSFKRKVASRSANRLNMMSVSKGRMEKFFWNKDRSIPARDYAKNCSGSGVVDSVPKTPSHLQPSTPIVRDVFKIDAPPVDKVNPITQERCFSEVCKKLDDAVEMKCKINVCEKGQLKDINLKPPDHNICTKRSKVCKAKRPDTKTCPGEKPGNLKCSKSKSSHPPACCPKIDGCAASKVCKNDTNAFRKLMVSVFEFFAPRPNCPHPTEWKTKQNKLKAEKAAHEAGMCLVKPPNPTGKRKMSCSAGPPPESKSRTQQPSSEPSPNCENKTEAKTDDECPAKTEYDERNPCPRNAKCEKVASPCCPPTIERCLCVTPPKPRPPCRSIEAPYPSFSEARCHDFARPKINECAVVHEKLKEQRRKQEQPGIAPKVINDDSELKRLIAELQVACGGPPPEPPKPPLKCPADRPTPKKVEKIPPIKPVPCKPAKLENKTPPTKQCCKPKQKAERPPCVKGVPQAAPLDKYKEKCKTPSKCLSTFCPVRRSYDIPSRFSKTQIKYKTNWQKTRKDKVEKGNEARKPISRTVERGALNAVGQTKLFGYD